MMRTIVLAVLAAAFLEAEAQTPPTPPTLPLPPAPPARPAPVAPDAWAVPRTPPLPPMPRAPEVGDLWHGQGFGGFGFDHDFRYEEMQRALEASRIDHTELTRAFERDVLHEQLRAVEMSRAHIDDARYAAVEALTATRAARAEAPRPFGFGAPMNAESFGRPPLLEIVAPAPWLAQDPADSLYRAARDLLNRSQHRSAAETFRQISQRFPSSGYTPDAMYFEAYSLYKIGGQNELRAALQVLDRQKQRFPNAKIPDPALSTRIRGELASRGDQSAAAQVSRVASQQGQSCNRDEMTVRLEALNALSRMNVDSTTPILRRVLARRDECSVTLRRQAITLMAKTPDAAATDVIIDVLKNDPAPEVRRAAISWLGEVPSDRGSAALEEILRSPREEALHGYALRALASSRNPRASQALRAVIERNDVSENLRREAMSTLARTDTAGAGAYLRSLFPKLESRRLQEYALTQIARLRGEENQRWMLAYVRDTTAPVVLRRSALSSLTRSSATTIPEIGALFNGVPELELRQSIISTLASRKEPEAVDQLIAIYRASNDPKLHVQIINVLSRRDDPRTQKLLLEILNK